MKINVTDKAADRYCADLLWVEHQQKWLFNRKGYYQKLIDNFYKVGYYDNNESIIPLLVDV